MFKQAHSPSNRLKKLQFKIDRRFHEERLDIALTKLMPDMSRRKIRSVIDMGGCYINRKRARIASRSVHSGDMVQLEFSDATIQKRRPVENLTKEHILYEDGQIIIINKPSGLASQPTRTNAKDHVLAQVKALVGGKYTPYLVHRLDQETSGAMIVAKSKESSDVWSAIFKERSIEKYYLALSRGFHQRKTASIKTHLTRIHPTTGLVKVSEGKERDARPAHTDIEILDYNKRWNISLVRCQIFTGRSHQIRVHLASVNLPIWGDKKYNSQLVADLPGECQGTTAKHQMLHASQLTFVHPLTKKTITVEAPVPKDWKSFTDLFIKTSPS